MIEIQGVNKYYRNGSARKTQVVKDLSLSLPDKGIVMIVGASGSGKTSLVSSICGLTGINSGKIVMDSEQITKRSARRSRKTRALHIGSIFQNIGLIDGLTVIDNMKIPLKIAGIKDETELAKRAGEVLELVGLKKHCNRRAGMLSGGERERVMIARAIIADPDVIIADEPTSALDKVNVKIVMEVFRVLAEKKLVIMVTHDLSLIDKYADMLISVDHGVSKQVECDSLKLDDLGGYYLPIDISKFKNHFLFAKGSYRIEVYDNNDADRDISLSLVWGNGMLSIYAGNNCNVKLLDEQPGVSTDNYDETRGEIKRLLTKYKFNKRYSSIVTTVSSIKDGFSFLKKTRVKKKFEFFIFFFSSILIMLTVSTIMSIIGTDDSSFTTRDDSYLLVTPRESTVKNYNKLNNMSLVNYVMPGDSCVEFAVLFDGWHQTREYTIGLDGSLSDIEVIGRNEIVAGKYPTRRHEVVIDRTSLVRAMEDEDISEVGIGGISDFIDNTIATRDGSKYKIKGIVDRGTPCIYCYRKDFTNIILNSFEGDYDIEFEDNELVDYSRKKSKYKASVKGKLVDYNVIISDYYKGEKKYEKGQKLPLRVNGHRLKIAGYYSLSDEGTHYLANSKMMLYSLIEQEDQFTVSTKSKSLLQTQLEEAGYNVKDPYVMDKERYEREKWSAYGSFLFIAFIIIMISMMEMIVIMRNSLSEKINDIVIYLALGIKSTDIYKMFFGRIFALTTMYSISGIVSASALIKLMSFTDQTLGIKEISWQILIDSIIIVYITNIITGMIPVHLLTYRFPLDIARKE